VRVSDRCARRRQDCVAGRRRVDAFTCKIQGQPTSVVVTVHRNAAGQTQHLVVNHLPRSCVMLFARLVGQKYAGAPLAKYFITSED
jgi:hypothetical protein